MEFLIASASASLKVPTWSIAALALLLFIAACGGAEDGGAPTTVAEGGESPVGGGIDLSSAHATVSYAGTSHDFDNAITCTLSSGEAVPLRATFADDEQFFGNPDDAAIGLAIGRSGDDTRIQLKLDGLRWDGLPGPPTITGGTATWGSAELGEVDGLADPITATIEVSCG